MAWTLLAFAPLTAQLPNETSPTGMSAQEGGGRHALIRSGVVHRFQQIDSGSLGAPRTLVGLALRSDAAGSTGPDRATFVVRLGHADEMMAFADFEDCFAAPGPSTVVDPRTVALPDWSAPGPGVAPFDLVLRFDRPFAYDGVRPLVVDILTQGHGGPAGSAVFVDLDRVAPRIDVGRSVGAGCAVAGQPAPMSHTMQIENQGPGAPLYSMRMEVTLRHAPPGAATILNMDLADPALSLPGVCGVIRSLPARTVALGATDPAGGIFGAAFTCPFIPHLVGLTFHTQMISLDTNRAGVPVALSEGRVATMPFNGATHGHDVVSHSADAPAEGGALDFGAGIVIGLLW